MQYAWHCLSPRTPFDLAGRDKKLMDRSYQIPIECLLTLWRLLSMDFLASKSFPCLQGVKYVLKNLRAFLCLFQAQSMSPDQVMSAGHDSNPLGKIPHNPFLPWRSRLRYIVGDSIEAYVVILSHNIGENSRMYWTKKTFDGCIRKWTAKLSTFLGSTLWFLFVWCPPQFSCNYREPIGAVWSIAIITKKKRS